MTVFKPYEFGGDLEEADKETLVETLTDFMEKHTENAEAFETLESDLSDVQAEYDALQDQVTSFKEDLAKEAAEGTPLTEEELVQFDLDRLAEIAGDSGKTQETTEAPEEPEEPESKFSEPKEPKTGELTEEDLDKASKDFARGQMEKLF